MERGKELLLTLGLLCDVHQHENIVCVEKLRLVVLASVAYTFVFNLPVGQGAKAGADRPHISYQWSRPGSVVTGGTIGLVHDFVGRFRQELD